MTSDVLVDRDAHDFLGTAMKARVDDLHPGIAQTRARRP